jgi:acyl-CoA synthetase (AMP-forming)/AMP-acid ligase II
MPKAVAVVEPLGYDGHGNRIYRQLTFRELDDDSNRIARGLGQLGVKPGTRIALMVRPGIDFISLVFAMFKAGAVAILIDPGMGRRNLARCLAEAEPEGFVGIPVAHALRILLWPRFSKARLNVTVGRRWFWGGPTLADLRRQSDAGPVPIATSADDPAAIIFTTGSTGPPKGVLYRHGNFDAQVDQLRDFYGIRPGEIDLPCFPLFALFNCAMGVTAVIPDMDPSRPAQVDPAKIVEAVRDWKITQAFGSPAIWNRVGRYCQDRGLRLATLRRVLSAGAPVPADVLERMRASIHPDGEVHTPYGATEALPVASIAASEVLGATIFRTRYGAGVCVGPSFPGIQWKVVRIVTGPIGSLADVEELPPA